MADNIVARLRSRADWYNPEDEKALDREAADEIERLRAECEEQARLNGMGAERELGLRAEVEELRARVKDLEGVIKWGQGF